MGGGGETSHTIHRVVFVPWLLRFLHRAVHKRRPATYAARYTSATRHPTPRGTRAPPGHLRRTVHMLRAVHKRCPATYAAL